jgi:hypothetical protein
MLGLKKAWMEWKRNISTCSITVELSPKWTND